MGRICTEVELYMYHYTKPSRGNDWLIVDCNQEYITPFKVGEDHHVKSISFGCAECRNLVVKVTQLKVSLHNRYTVKNEVTGHRECNNCSHPVLIGPYWLSVLDSRGDLRHLKDVLLKYGQEYVQCVTLNHTGDSCIQK